MSEPMPTIPTQSPFTYPNPNPSASPSFTQDDTSESFIPEPTQPMPTFTQPAFSQPAFTCFQNPFYLKKAQQFEPKLYDGNVIKNTSAIVIPDSEETLMLDEGVAVEQHRLESKTFEVKMNQVLNENERLLEQVINKDIVNIVVNSSVDNASVNVHECKNGNVNEENVKKYIDEIESINIELEHSMAKLISENENLRNEREHLKSIFKNQFDSIKKTRVQSKEHSESLIAQINAKSIKNSDLNAQLQEKHTMEQDAILRETVEQAKSINPLDSTSYTACKYVKIIQELLGYIRDTCPDIHKPIEKLVARPIGRTFTIVGNGCPLTRITTTTEVPLRKPTALNNETPKPVVTLVYSRKPRKSKTKVSVSKSKVVQIVLCYLDSGCSKHMIRDRSQLTNLVNKFLGTVKFGIDHVVKILGYGNYQIGNVTISRVYYVEGLGHNLFSIGQFCDSNLEVAFRQHTCFIRNLEGLPKLKFEKDHLYSACEMGKSKKKPHKPKSEDTNQEKLYLLHMDLCGPMRVASAEAVATACYTQNRSIVRLCHKKTPYKLLHDTLPDLSFFHVFGALCYPTDGSENLGKLQPKADIDFDELTVMAFEHSSLGPALHEMTPATISLGLVPNPLSSTPFVPPSRNDWDILFQPLFDELLTPPPSVDHPAPKVIAPIAEVVAPEPAASTGSPSSTTVDQDTPSPNIAHMNNDPFFGIPIPENDSEASSSSDVIPIVVQSVAPYSEHELVPHPDKVMVITLKWIYKVKLDEMGGILKNKARLVARGYRQEEGIDF
ncbi:retrovirus-related pol polyprotein from transposon TNT 1-94 [Tanacetum coccineum]